MKYFLLPLRNSRLFLSYFEVYLFLFCLSLYFIYLIQLLLSGNIQFYVWMYLDLFIDT